MSESLQYEANARKFARAELAELKRDHEAMEALRRGAVDCVYVAAYSRKWKSCTPKSRPHPMDDFGSEDPADAILAAKAGKESDGKDT